MEIESDILIIGGGVSGIYCAWRLSKEYPEKKIIVIEKRDFLGGRLESIPFGNKEIYAEVGGMRTFPNIDKYLTKILHLLNIKTTLTPYNEPKNIAYVKDNRMNVGVIDKSGINTKERQELISLYDIPIREYNESVSTIITNVVEEEAPNYEVDPSSVYTSNKLNNISFIEMLKEENVSNGAIKAFIDFSGYNFSIDSPTAASTGIRENISISGVEQQYFVEGGYVSLVLEMAKEISSRKNTKLILSTSLKELHRLDDKTQLFECVLDNNGYIFNIMSKEVILAIPRDDLLNVYAPWNINAQTAMLSVNRWRAFKAFLLVDKRTYNIMSKNGKIKGRCISDLPARQIWLYCDDPACILIYADDKNADYWKQYIDNGTDSEYPEFKNPRCNIPLVKEIKRQIGIVFQINPSDILVNKILYKYWNAGAYFWEPSNIPFLVKSIQKPLGEKFDVFTNGSDFSFFQGWTEGALENADELLVNSFGLNSILK
jgi:hypothetical protein